MAFSYISFNLQCDIADPCQYSCVNLSPGYECTGCLPGYVGNTPHGIGVEHALANQQVRSKVEWLSTNHASEDYLHSCQLL